ncbi:MAG: phosphoribosylformylglycinamidine synthase subunit PurL [Thermoplasmata archaeon]|nr:phosphoribosylformylglycinamidine synthase subunit PurL [Thermoplasmata archaeon]
MGQTIEIDIIDVDEDELLQISNEGLLALNLEEMRKLRAYFKGLGRNPTDVELETLAQSWSEHCVHKTFKGHIRTTKGGVDNLLKSTIMKVTQDLNLEWCVSVFEDNAGIVRFDDNYDVAMKVETHNHPTALDPYGGAGTGSGGVFRDVLGVGAKPILSTDVLFFGPPDYDYELLPKGVMHPKRLMKGSVAGIRDYGNRMGIPTGNGGVGFDVGYIGNPLIYAGVVGIMPHGKYVHTPRTGDAILLVGGKTGRDGIHGVTFASIELDTQSEHTSSGAVQIGNPIEEKKIVDAMLRARDKNSKPLYSAITDCGGGGLSSAVGEMGKNLGIEVELDKVPLKYEGLKPWEIWVSESQERMLLAVPQENLSQIVEIFELENCPATVIGKFRDDKKLILTFKGAKVAELDMVFVHKGVPRVSRRARWVKPTLPDAELPAKDDYTEDLKKILTAPNVASKEWVVRQYDHEVQGQSITKPLQGFNCDGPGDSIVLKPIEDSWQGVVVSNGVNPKYSFDPYNMALSAIDEAVRNNVCSGGRRIAILDNFSWGNPEKEDVLGQLLAASKACYEGAMAYGTPFISGKDSLYNEYIHETGESVAIPPTLLISAVGIIPDVRKAVTMDFKSPGSLVYIIGETKYELGGSHYWDLYGYIGNNIPTIDTKRVKHTTDSIIQAMDKGLIKACHDCSEGGLAVAAAEMAFAGEIGVELELGKVPVSADVASRSRNDIILFSESNTRFIVEVSRDHQSEFEKIMSGIKLGLIGSTASKHNNLIIKGLKGAPILKVDLTELKEVWKSTFRW